MSNKSIEPLRDPGVPHHVHRKADHDPRAEKRAERQIASLFLISALGTVLVIYSYIFIPSDTMFFFPILGHSYVQQVCLGLGLAISLFFIGLGAIQWARTLMPDHEVIDHRKEFRSADADRKEFVDTVKTQSEASGLGRRSIIKRSLGLALGLVGLSPIVLLRDLGPVPGKSLEKNFLASWYSIGIRPAKSPYQGLGLRSRRCCASSTCSSRRQRANARGYWKRCSPFDSSSTRRI